MEDAAGIIVICKERFSGKSVICNARFRAEMVFYRIQELKNVYDRYPGLHIIFTGSSLLQIDFSLADLSRRCIFYILQGLSFREFLAFEGKSTFSACTLDQILRGHLTISAEVVSKMAVIPLFEEYLRHGYYPFYKEAPLSYSIRLQQIITTILENDLPAIEKVEYVSIKKMRKRYIWRTPI